MIFKKLAILLLILIFTPVLAGFYGILHDQFTYTISPEYFTKFKFDQFDVDVAVPYRLGVSYVGWMATWWMGIPLGLVLGFIGLIHPTAKRMLKVYFKSILVIVGVAFLVGIIGLLFGRLFLIDKDLSWYFPENLIDRKRFILVGSMHNFSYLGGFVGLVFGVVYQVRYKKRRKAEVDLNN